MASAPARSRMIAERRKRSTAWRIIHWLGSLQLALILLATIGLACAIATFTESNFNSRIAQAYIYKAPWFQIWLGVLCVNLFAVTLTRWPWQKKHIGFVVTHYGIITLLIGAMIGMQTGFEGNVTLRKNAPPISRVTTGKSIVQLESPADSALYLMPFDAETASPSGRRPRIFHVPGTKLRVVADDFSANLVQEQRFVPSEGTEGVPSALLRLSSKMAGQTVEISLALSETRRSRRTFSASRGSSFDRTFRRSPPPRCQRPKWYSPTMRRSRKRGARRPAFPSGLAKRGRKSVSFRPTASERPTSATRSWIAGSRGGRGRRRGELLAGFRDEERKAGKQVGSPEQPCGADPNFETPGKPGRQPETKPRACSKRRRCGLSALAHRTIVASERRPQAILLFSAGRIGRRNLVQFLPKARLVTEIKPGPPLSKGEQGLPGFRAHLESPDGRRGEDRWVASGEITALTDGSQIVRMGYGLEAKPLPFSLRLLNFEVPRDEGTDTPSNFIATIEFRDSSTGATKTSFAKMNHPASFPGTPTANLTGFNYKFSQAEWNPRDLDETTLQVLYDPGWLPKWIGSLGICLGIAIMFYWKPGDANPNAAGPTRKATQRVGQK